MLSLLGAAFLKGFYRLIKYSFVVLINGVKILFKYAHKFLNLIGIIFYKIVTLLAYLIYGILYLFFLLLKGLGKALAIVVHVILNCAKAIKNSIQHLGFIIKGIIYKIYFSIKIKILRFKIVNLKKKIYLTYQKVLKIFREILISKTQHTVNSLDISLNNLSYGGLSSRQNKPLSKSWVSKPYSPLNKFILRDKNINNLLKTKFKFMFKDLPLFVKVLWKNKVGYFYIFAFKIRFFTYKFFKFIITEILLVFTILLKFLKSYLAFIYYDLLMIKKISFWIRCNIMKFFAVCIILISFITSTTYFYKNQAEFFNNAAKSSESMAFLNVAGLIVKIKDSDIFLPIVFYKVDITVEAGSSLYDILVDNEISKVEALSITQKINKQFNLRNISPKWVVNVVLVSSNDWKYNKLQSLTLPVSDTYDLILEADKNYNYTVYKQEKRLARYIFKRQFAIRSSLFESAIKAGVPNAVSAQLLKILSWDVDFEREIRENDVIEIIYECLYNQNDQLVGCDNIIYGSLKGSVKNTSFYKYEGEYYHEDGRSTSKTLVKTPINNPRLTSGFGMRNHPVLGYTLLHRGVDFGAAPGTPIFASGDGVVVRAGWFGDYGNYVRIRHNPYLESVYAHMKEIAPKLKAGSKVKQWQVIGSVGATGRVTGPHLHYEVLVNGKHVNPLTIKMPSDKKIGEENIKDFEIYKTTLSTLIVRLPKKGRLLSPIMKEIRGKVDSTNPVIMEANIAQNYFYNPPKVAKKS
ncbi:Peptidase M23 [Candidatus Hepatincolaceae symbiont of Richtersius coronifer]